MEDQYGMADLRQYISSRPLFPPIPPPPDLLSAHRGGLNPYDMLIFRSDSVATANNNNAGGAAASSSAGFGGFESGLNGGDSGAGRWPRQETLTLLEIRSRLDPKFKEANQKGPLWDEVSRIMSEEHGYNRSGKKCREKFENLYKYYKKTKEGKAGRQDGKHYRFFRQLEALYGGEPHTTSASMSEAAGSYHVSFPNKSALLSAPKLSDTSLSLSNYSEAETSSSDDSDEGKMMIKKRGGWKVKIREFIDVQMKKLMDKQEAWMEKMMKAMEEKERERAMREEEWRKHDAARIEREHKFWASERAWIEARDAALMDALHKLTAGKDAAESNDDGGSETMADWAECEVNRLIQLMEGKLEAEEMVWEEIATKMACFGHDRSAAACKDKWESIHTYALKCGSKKRKDTSKGATYFTGVYCDTQTSEQGNISLNNNHDHGSSSPNPNTAAAAAMSESCFRYFMGDAYGRIIG
ncbi:trihelix transcription factor PTL [Salvia miltiorrhiza]|uniref:trihelix transcription factor PTL n=1 Tax=Salvia miltiorrhiza TaxID=226208 RepID=UPI0025AC48E4|nr:trihelix transcription factor PTL [Salvia miltiorrhiza]